MNEEQKSKGIPVYPGRITTEGERQVYASLPYRPPELVAAVGDYTRQPVGWACFPTSEDGFVLFAHEYEAEDIPAYYLVFDLTRDNLAGLEAIAALALSVSRARLERGAVRRAVRAWRIPENTTAYSLPPTKTDHVGPSAHTANRTLRIEIPASELEAASAVSVGEYTPAPVTWLWGYGEKGEVVVYVASLGRVAGAFYPTLRLTRQNLSRLKEAITGRLQEEQVAAPGR